MYPRLLDVAEPGGMYWVLQRPAPLVLGFGSVGHRTMTDQPDPDELPALVAALQRKCNALAGENQELRETVENLEAQVEVLRKRAPDPSQMAYDQMDKADKVTVLRSRLATVADNRGGKAAWNYDEVIDAFAGHPSPGHAYDLMELAADVEGFEHGTDMDGQKRITVRTDAVNADADFHGANKGGAVEGA